MIGKPPTGAFLGFEKAVQESGKIILAVRPNHGFLKKAVQESGKIILAVRPNHEIPKMAGQINEIRLNGCAEDGEHAFRMQK